MKFKKITLLALLTLSLTNLIGAQTDYTYIDGIRSPSGVITSIDNLIIQSGTLNINTNMTVATITVKPGSILTVETGVTLTATLIDLESTSSSYSSFLCEGTYIGLANYHRHTEQIGTNDLISAPVSGQAFAAFATVNTNLASSGNLRAFGPFDTSLGSYINYDVLGNATTFISAGQGYRAATTDGAGLTFTGTVETGDVLGIPISDGAFGAQWNLIGNPYPSYIDFEAFFDHNKTQFQTGAYQAIYGYDGDASDGWVIWNQAVIDSPITTEKLAPGQAFFVKSKMGGGSVDFTASMRTTGTSDDFIAGRSETTSPHHGYIKLNSSSDGSNFSTDIYFNSNATSSFDPGYDTGLYGQTAPEFSIYSNLVEENTGVALAIQALNPDSMYDAVVPLGVNALQGQLVTISILDTDMPDNVEIYLEDTLNNTSTLLNTNDFVFTPESDISGTGRFYLNYTTNALSVVDSELEAISIISNNNNETIEIKGQLYSDTKAELYDTNGRLILESALNSKSTTQILDVKYLTPGVYILALNGNKANEKRVEKLIIN